MVVENEVSLFPSEKPAIYERSKARSKDDLAELGLRLSNHVLKNTKETVESVERSRGRVPIICIAIVPYWLQSNRVLHMPVSI